MSKAKLFQYVVIWNPTEKQVKEENLKPKIIVPVTDLLSDNEDSVRMAAAMNIPSEYKEQLDQIDIAVRPF